MNIPELRTTTNIKAKFAQDRHKEKVELCNLRFGQVMKVMERRDKFAKDRHKEKIEMME